jgi:hypothetical protein
MSTGYNNRVSWDDYCFEIASVVSRRSTCPRAAMGAVLTKHRQIIGTGYNGAAPGLPHCLERNQTLTQHLEIDHCAWAIHAERNAVYNTFVQVDGATLYVVGPRPIATLDSLAHDIRGWQTVTFPQATPASVALHLRREAAELACAPSDPEEIADIFHLLVAAAEANGYDLIDIVAAKFTVNLARRWQAPDSTGVVEHVREVAP